MKRPLRTTLIVFGAVIAVCAILSAAVAGLTLLSSHDVRSHKDFAFSGDTLVIDVGDGSLRLEPGADAGSIAVDRRITESINGPDPKWSLSGDRLTLDTNCPLFFGITCDGDYTVKVPAGIPLVVTTDNGSVTASGLPQNAHISTDNGSITVRDSTGELNLSTDNGSIRAEEVSSAKVRAETSNGSVRLRFTTAPSDVDARTDNGSVRVVVPEDGRRYAVEVKTDNGSVHTTVPEDPASEHRITARTDNGSVDVRTG